MDRSSAGPVSFLMRPKGVVIMKIAKYEGFETGDKAEQTKTVMNQNGVVVTDGEALVIIM